VSLDWKDTQPQGHDRYRGASLARFVSFEFKQRA
jgi:hypothetical protein